jgi:DNA repair protein RecO (recombination protein O)
MRIEQQPGFVLHARPWRETSLLIELLSRDHGRVGLVARGVRNPRSRLPRSALQPLTPLLVGWSGSGELATLIGAEAAGAPFPLTGESLLCALYINELVARLVPRNDPHAEVFDTYLAALTRLADADAPAWTLRRFERDLLAQLGYAAVLDSEADGATPLEPQRHYAYRLDAGPVPWHSASDGLRLRGSALLAMAQDRQPDAEDLRALRRLMRALITQHLGGRGLQAWSLFQPNNEQSAVARSNPSDSNRPESDCALPDSRQPGSAADDER